MKTLKRFTEGLITHQILSTTSHLQEPLYMDANFNYTSNSLTLNDGIVYYFIEDVNTLVFEVIDEFSPHSPFDVGGITVVQGNRTHNLYQYENEVENINYKHSRVTKIIKNYYGEGSDNGIDWHSRGHRFLPSTDLIGVSYDAFGGGSFPINEIKIYHEPSWYIHGLFEGCTLKIYNETEDTLLHDIIVDRSNVVKITDRLYPHNCKILAWDTDNVQVLNTSLTEVWGGDHYSMSIEVELYNRDRTRLYLEEAKHIGAVRQGTPLREMVYAVNYGTNDVLATLRIMEESPAYDWVHLEYSGIIGKEIQVPIEASGENTFHIVIAQPIDNITVTPGLSASEEHAFFLELS